MAAFSLSVYPKALATLPELWAYTAVFSRYTQNSGENRRIFLKIQIFGQQRINLPFYAQNLPIFWVLDKKTLFYTQKFHLYPI